MCSSSSCCSGRGAGDAQLLLCRTRSLPSQPMGAPGRVRLHWYDPTPDMPLDLQPGPASCN